MYRLFDKRDNMTVSMIQDNPTLQDGFVKFREQIRKNTEEQKRERQNNRGKGPTIVRNSLQKPVSLFGPCIMSATKSTSDASNLPSSFYDPSQVMPSQKHQQNLQISHIMPVVLKIDKISINKIELSSTLNYGQETTLQNQSNLEREPESNKFKSITMNLNLSRRILSIDFEMYRGVKEDKMADEASIQSNPNTEHQNMRLEMGFSNIQEFEIFTEINSLRFHSQSWEILELYQESPTKPKKWNSSFIKRLLGTSLPEGEDTELTIEVYLKSDPSGRNFSLRTQTLDKIFLGGLPFKVNGRTHRFANMASNKGPIMRYLPTKQDHSDSSNLPPSNQMMSVNQADIQKQGFSETGLREIIDSNELKNFKELERDLEMSKLQAPDDQCPTSRRPKKSRS